MVLSEATFCKKTKEKVLTVMGEISNMRVSQGQALVKFGD